MRNKKAKIMRKMAQRVAAMDGKPAVSYVLVDTYHGNGAMAANKSVQLGDCVRRVYQTMKRRYKQRSWV